MSHNTRDPQSLRGAMLAWLGAKLPGALIDLPEIEEAKGGHSSETLFLDPVITRAGQEERPRWVLRIQATGHQVYQDPAVEKQVRIMQAVERAGVAPVPKVLWFEPDPAVVGAPFFIMERLDGIVADEYYHSRGLLFDATPAERERMWLSGVEAMAGLHRLDPADAAFLDRPALGPTGLDQEIAAWDGYVTWAGVRHNDTLAKAREWMGRNVPAVRPTAVAWGDARLGNLIFRDQRCVGVLDWETASLGGPESDLGWWVYYDWWITEGLGVPRLEGIGGRDETIRAWEEFSGRKAEAMEWHEVFGTYRFAIISERAIDLANAMGSGLPVAGGDANPAIKRLKQLLG